MRSVIAFFLLTIMLVSTTQFYEVVKLPVLISHYLHHKQEDGSSIASFFKMHYKGNDKKDDDWQTDRKLPFKMLILPSQQ